MIIIPEVSIFSNPLRDSARRIVPLLAIFFYFYAKISPVAVIATGAIFLN